MIVRILNHPRRPTSCHSRPTRDASAVTPTHIGIMTVRSTPTKNVCAIWLAPGVVIGGFAVGTSVRPPTSETTPLFRFGVLAPRSAIAKSHRPCKRCWKVQRPLLRMKGKGAL